MTIYISTTLNHKIETCWGEGEELTKSQRTLKVQRTRNLMPLWKEHLFEIVIAGECDAMRNKQLSIYNSSIKSTLLFSTESIIFKAPNKARTRPLNKILIEFLFKKREK